MPKFKISKGFRKFLRQKKAGIRRQVLNSVEQEHLIRELYKSVPLKEFSSSKNSDNKSSQF